MPMLEERVTLHVPPVCSRPRLLRRLFESETPMAILDPRVNDPLEDLRVNGCDFKVHAGSREYLETFLATPLSSEVDCWAPLLGGTSWLPVDMGKMWRVLPAGGEMPVVEDSPCARVLFEDETSVAALFCNAWRYEFDNEAGVFRRHPDPARNAIKAVLRDAVVSRSGGTDDRIADYGRLVLFLLSKVSLTEEERAAFAPLAPFFPTAEALSGVISREKCIRTLVEEAKKDPIGFAGWNGDWNRPWWKGEHA